jgi:hypothetical protein
MFHPFFSSFVLLCRHLIAVRMSTAIDAIGSATVASSNTQFSTATVALELEGDLANCASQSVDIVECDLKNGIY